MPGKRVSKEAKKTIGERSGTSIAAEYVRKATNSKSGEEAKRIARERPKKANVVKYKPEVLDELFLRMESGESLVSISCDEHMPSLVTVGYWRRKYPDFDKRLQEAQDARTVLHGEYILDALEKAGKGLIHPDVGRVMINGYSRVMELYNPRRFGRNLGGAVAAGGQEPPKDPVDRVVIEVIGGTADKSD